MTIKEFKCWLDGYTADWSHNDKPTTKQWKTIRAKLNEVEEEEPHYPGYRWDWTVPTIVPGPIGPYDPPSPYIGDPITSPSWTSGTVCNGQRQTSCCDGNGEDNGETGYKTETAKA